VEDGGMQLTADKIDISQQSGDAFAHGDVKATWLNENRNASGRDAAGKQNLTLGGDGPAHAVAQEAQVQRATDEATFTGHARLWQQANSISAPVIVLNRQKKTLAAQSTDASEPVRVVDVSSNKNSGAKTSASSVIRVRGGDLVYSDVARKALIVGGALGPVVAETNSATSTSSQVEIFLSPAGSHSGNGQGQVERMIATGHVVLSSGGRRGTGEKLTYTGDTGEYVLTGAGAAPPKIVDPTRGTATGAALIFHGSDDSVSIEGGGGETRTDTTVRQINGRREPQK
jgi:lipopolysaccharide export system protein LptA